MGYENESYRDEDGKPLMEFDEIIQSNRDKPDLNLLDNDGVYVYRDRSPTLVYNDSNSRPRKRLLKKSSGKEFGPSDLELNDHVSDGGRVGLAGYDYSDGRKRKREIGEKKTKEEKGVKNFRVKTSGGGRMRDHEAHPEMKEKWDTSAGSNSKTKEDDEINQLFKIGKKKKKNERSPAEITLQLESVMAELEFAYENDAELNRQEKPAITKLRKLHLLTDVLTKKQLQHEFLDRGILTILKNWLEPLPDGSFPNINVRAAVFQALNDLSIDLEQFDRREQLKKSGLGKVIMFFSKWDEEITSNRKLAKELVDKWSRPIFNKSTRFEDMKNFDHERMYRRPPPARSNKSNASRRALRDDDLNLAGISQGQKSGQSSSGQHASWPEAMAKIDPEAVQAHAKQVAQDQRRAKMNKKLQQLKAPKRKQLQATKLSVEGRGMVKYL